MMINAHTKWRLKWQDRLERLPAFKNAIRELATFFPTLGKECPKNLKWKNGRALFFDLWVSAPDEDIPYPEGSPRRRLSDLCQKHRIAYFIGKKPFPKPLAVLKTDLKTGKRSLESPFEIPDEVWPILKKEFNATHPGAPSLAKHKPILDSEILEQLAKELYDTVAAGWTRAELEKDSWAAGEINRRVAKSLNVSVKRLKNILSAKSKM